MTAFLVSIGIVALAEMGDKTQLLALVLAARFRRPIPIIAGILAATLLNHAAAGALGAWITSVLSADILRWVLGVSFMAMGAWTLIPDTFEGEPSADSRVGVFGATVIAFFLAEMGDKTQVATVALAARYAVFLPVVLGTTLGMLLANAPVVVFGDWLTKRIPMRTIRIVAAIVLVVMGTLTLLNVGQFF